MQASIHHKITGDCWVLSLKKLIGRYFKSSNSDIPAVPVLRNGTSELELIARYESFIRHFDGPRSTLSGKCWCSIVIPGYICGGLGITNLKVVFDKISTLSRCTASSIIRHELYSCRCSTSRFCFFLCQRSCRYTFGKRSDPGLLLKKKRKGVIEAFP